MKQFYSFHFILRTQWILLLFLFSLGALTAQVRVVGISDKDAGTIFSFDSSEVAVETWINLNEYNLPSSPRGALVGSEGKFWGVSRNGGQFGKGSIFSVNPNGTDLEVLYSFSNQDGFNPEAGLTLHKGKLWGTTSLGGTSNKGVIFNWEITSGLFTKVADFDSTNGANPRSPLTVAGDKIWGNTSAGGANDAGVIFRVNDDESGFLRVHDFSGMNGSSPSVLSLILIDGKLWGLTGKGGTTDEGVIFSVDTTTLAYNVAYEFDSGSDDFYEPFGGLTLSNGKIWGTARNGGANNFGAIFTINTDGSNLTKVHDFVISEGEEANGGLVESMGKLWGMTLEGGEFGDGVVFSIDTSGNNFTKVLDLESSSFGRFTSNPLAAIDGKVYGMTQLAGLYNQGTIFSIDPENNQSELVRALNRNSLAYQLDSSLVDAYGKLWGISTEGGPSNSGNIFSMDRDGSNFTVIHNFDSNVGPSGPSGSLLAAFDRIWGIAQFGGSFEGGILYSFNSEGNDFTVHHEFGEFPDGAIPNHDLLAANGKLYGTTSLGGENLTGTIFSLNADGSGYNTLVVFDFDNGSNPKGGLIEANGKLWGVTEEGGAGVMGNLFSLNYDGSAFTSLYEFSDTGDGFFPRANLVAINDKIFGTTQGDELSTASGQSIFVINDDGTGFQVVQELTANATTTGYGTRGKLIAAEGLLWGVNSYGGVNDNGTIFTIDPSDLSVKVEHSFDVLVDGELPAGGLTPYAGRMWGHTQKGGANSRGVIYSIGMDGSGFTVERDVTFGDFGGEPANIPLLVLKNLSELQVDTTIYTYGDDAFTFSVISDEEQDYEFLSTNNEVILMKGDTAVISGAGSSLVSTFHAETETFKADSLKTRITVAKAPLTVTANNLTRAYNEQNPTFTYSYEGFVYNEDSSALLVLPQGATDATIDSDVGTYDIAVDGAESNNYDLSYVGATLTIVQANQEITFDTLESRIEGDPDFNLAAVASSGLSVSYTASNDSVIVINDDQVSIIGAGTVEITANQIGNNNYLAAEPVSRTLVVEAAVSTSIEEGLDISRAIYPNPVTRQFRIQTDFNYLEVVIYDIEGRMVKRFGKQDTYYVGNLTTGTYLVELRNSQQVKRGRLIVR